MKPQWKCTVEHDPDPEFMESRVGWTSVDYYSHLELHMTARWRTRDADGHTTYEGIATPNTKFEPLDEFARPDVGDVEIQYFENGQWVTL